ncbi:NAD(P)-dependent oxidoreductase [Achromobacter xylosoxidans]|uniref:NAD(P)-dependent oxidoreductase n=1 Tax=Alcaligenes xylosoxydans xylosoxydans TaxID=85698 RepID=UPI0006651328|nr:NAD(P)-dependent oxidoreductase [Achromobacter xylosoxidans]
METTREVGYVGLGQMGGAIAERLLRPGIRLHVHDASARAIARFEARGAVPHPSARSVADSADIVFACLPHPDASLAVALGADGVAAGRRARIYADMSTLGTETMERLARELAASGITALDAPVTGGPPAAREGRLTLLVAGPDAAVDQARPLLQAMGGAVHVIGPRAGMAQLMKVVNNIVMASNMAVACEGLSLGAKGGLDVGMMLEVLAQGTGQSFAANHILSRAVQGDYDFGAALAIVEKDTRLGGREAELLEVDLPLISLAARAWTQALESVGGAPDFTHLLDFYEARAGLRIAQGG